MRIDIISAVPQLLESPLQNSIPARAVEKGLAEVCIHNLHDYGLGKYKQVDDYQFGGGAGMVLMPEPLAACIETLKAERDYDEIIYLTPDGSTLDQSTCNTLSLCKNLMLICGHYKGIDQRIRDLYVTCEISIGDYVLSGGEIAAIVLTDSLLRLIPGVLGNEESALTDTFQDGLLAPPLYTRPAEFKGIPVPEILLSGDHKKIEEWRMEKAIEKTQSLRPDLWNDSVDEK
ncbi:MAG: tRNA (guanosine(37)-N1)-methyltransferase TrmD [Bacteroidia bacterium]|nr:tRNA (guanosine(37)-N1)-methyltransferase TrmD [Bacteroidia bacterium]